MGKNFLLEGHLCKEMNFGNDAAIRDKAPKTPIQPIFSYRFGDGSDTGPIPHPNRGVAKYPGIKENNPKVNPIGMPYYTTGGTIKPALHNPKIRK